MMKKDRAIILSLIMAVILAIPVYADDEPASEGPACDNAAVQSGLSETDETVPVMELQETGDPETININAADEKAAENTEKDTEKDTETEKDKEEVNKESTTENAALKNNEKDSSLNSNVTDNRTEEETTIPEDKPDVPLLRPSSWAAVFEAPGY
ncbi:MAG: hypothetical protein IJI11_03670 [Mogibacterium sp.]|nr:hypothetical protein [Mogibacterium sp.]